MKLFPAKLRLDLVSLSGLEENIMLEERILADINEMDGLNTTLRSFLYMSRDCPNYLKKRLEDIFSDKIASRDFRYELFNFTASITNAHFWNNDQNYRGKYEDFIENVFWGGEDVVSVRFKKLWSFIISDFEALPKPEEAGYAKNMKVLSGSLNFINRLVEIIYMAQNSPQYTKVRIDKSQLDYIVKFIKENNSFFRLKEIMLSFFSRDITGETYDEVNIIKTSWDIFVSLWKIVSLEKRTDSLNQARANFSQFIEGMLNSNAKYTHKYDGHEEPLYFWISPILYQKFSINSHYVEEERKYKPVSYNPILHITENRNVTVWAYAKVLHKFLKDLSDKQTFAKLDDNVVWRLVDYLENFLSSYIYTSLYEYPDSAGSIPLMPSYTLKEEIVSILKSYFSLILNNELPINLRNKTLGSFFDLNNVEWFLKNANFTRSFSDLSEHAFFVQNKGYLDTLFEELALSERNNIIPEVIRFSDSTQVDFYYKLTRYLLEKEHSKLKGNNDYIPGFKELLQRMEEAGEQNNNLGELIRNYLTKNGTVSNLTGSEGEHSAASPAQSQPASSAMEREKQSVSSAVEKVTVSSPADAQGKVSLGSQEKTEGAVSPKLSQLVGIVKDIFSGIKNPSRLIRDYFTDPDFLDYLPKNISRATLTEYIVNTNQFDNIIIGERKKVWGGDFTGLFGREEIVPITKHASGRLRAEQEDFRINLDYLRQIGINPERVLVFRVTQPSLPGESKPEYFWTTDFYETQRGLNREIAPEARMKSVTLVSTLEEINRNGGLIQDINDDSGISLRQIGEGPFDQARAVTIIPYIEKPSRSSNIDLTEWLKDHSSPKPVSSMAPDEKKPASSALEDAKGGIDFRSLPIVTEAVSNLRLSASSAISLSQLKAITRGGDSRLRGNDIGRVYPIAVDQELQEIEKLVEAGITPSSERIKEYVASSCLRGNLDMRKVVSCIASILRLEEDRCYSTEATLKDILVVLESGMPNQELRAVFTGVR